MYKWYLFLGYRLNKLLMEEEKEMHWKGLNSKTKS